MYVVIFVRRITIGVTGRKATAPEEPMLHQLLSLYSAEMGACSTNLFGGKNGYMDHTVTKRSKFPEVAFKM